MFTMLLAWVNSKYDTGYELLFIATFFIDIEIIQAVAKTAC